MKKYRLCVCPVHHKCIDSDGCWDRTYNDSYEYIIYDEEGIEVDGWDGYGTEEEARKAGEERLKRLEEKKC